MNHFKNKKHKDYLAGIAAKFKDKVALNKADLEFLFKGLIELHEIPFPPSELRKYFLHPNIIETLFIEVLNSKDLTPDDRRAMHKSFEQIHSLIKIVKSPYAINFRILAPGGNYPNVELERQSSKYTFTNQFPLLITKNRKKKDVWADTSLINWLTRTELRFATSMMCAANHILFHFHFTSHNSIEIDNNCFEKIPNELRVYFLRELLDIKLRFTPIGNNFWQRKPLPDINEYQFSDYERATNTFKELYDQFSIQNDLLLRTCNYLVKARMHWDNQINAEEAITNTFMCLEGCLHLMQKKFGDYKPQLNRVLLEKVFKEHIPVGENIWNFISEGYRTRITLLHAEPNWGAKWDPFIVPDDFYDYYKICLELLNFILLDRNVEF